MQGKHSMFAAKEGSVPHTLCCTLTAVLLAALSYAGQGGDVPPLCMPSFVTAGKCCGRLRWHQRRQFGPSALAALLASSAVEHCDNQQ